MSAVATVSVVIPCYRQGHFLPDAVDSLLAQSHPAVQPIVVDDGSDDDTAEVARRYGDRIAYVHQSNRGLPAARNAGIRLAEGRYLHFLDADDRMHPDALAMLVEAMGGSDNRLCLMGFRYFDESTDPDRGPVRLPPTGFSPLPGFIHHNPAPPHCYLAPTAMIRRVGAFDESLSGCADWDLWLRLAIEGIEGVCLATVGAYYRRHAGSMSRNTPLMLQERTHVLLRGHRRLAANPDAYGRWGRDLAEVAHRIRRRLLAANTAPELVEELNVNLRTLHRDGYGVELSFKKWLLDALLGDLGEQLFMKYLRRFDSRAWNFYTDGIW